MLKQILTTLAFASALALATACGDDGTGGGDDDDEGAGNSGNAGTGNSGNEGTGNTGNEGTGNTGNEGTGNSGNGGAGNTGNGGSGNEGTGNTGNTGGGDVSSCEDLCDLAPVDASTASCVTEYIALQGYDVGNPLCEAANTSQGCLLCYDAISVSDADCVAVHGLCF